VCFDQDIKGHRLPPQTLCLTYDDGPGADTLELGHYLHEEGVAATFFVMGRHAEERADVLRRWQAWGHLLANHTYSHPGLVALALAGGDVVGELIKTDEIIRPFVASQVTLLRPPYGNRREKQSPDNDENRRTSIVAAILNRSELLQNYVGPVNWDISATDYDFWRRGDSAAECARVFLAKIERIGPGILLHDSSAEEIVRRNNRTLELTQHIMPTLLAQGYRFVRLDEVP
jgi:peptidoglycan/xylan/chitin deacetylase (PgdA/CDA1 family)